MFFVPPPFMGRYRARGVVFDGTNDYMTRGAGLTGASDGKQLTAAVWLRKQGSDGVTQRILAGLDTLAGGSSALSFRVTKSTQNSIAIVGEDAGGTIVLNLMSSTDSFETADGWRCFLASVDMADTGKRHLYVNNTSDLNVTTYTDAAIDLTLADWSVGADGDGGNKIQADYADLRLWAGYIDLSVESNRRLFVTSSGKPVHPDLARSVLGTPLIDCRGPASAFGTNNGSGGNFTVTGTLTDASTSPSD